MQEENYELSIFLEKLNRDEFCLKKKKNLHVE